MAGIDTMVAQAYGVDDRGDCDRTLGQAFWFVLLGTPVVTLLTLGAIPLLPHFGTPADIVAETSKYLHALVWSTGPLLAYMALRRYLQGIDRVLLIMVSLVTSAAINFVGDWALLYGHLGAKPMGIAGSGWATCIVRVYMVLLLIGGTWLSLRSSAQPFSRRLLLPDFARLRILLRIGWPSSLASLTDLGVSTFMSILCARLGMQLLAAHQVVLDLDALVVHGALGVVLRHRCSCGAKRQAAIVCRRSYGQPEAAWCWPMGIHRRGCQLVRRLPSPVGWPLYQRSIRSDGRRSHLSHLCVYSVRRRRGRYL